MRSAQLTSLNNHKSPMGYSNRNTRKLKKNSNYSATFKNSNSRKLSISNHHRAMIKRGQSVEMNLVQIFNDYLDQDTMDEYQLSVEGIIEEINQRTMIEHYKDQLATSKRFLNMVIHDMRNPALSTKVGIEQVIHNIGQMKKLNAKFTEMERSYNLVAKEIMYQSNTDQLRDI